VEDRAAATAWALWNGTDRMASGQMWMRDGDADCEAAAGAMLDLGSVSQEDETWVNGTYLGASSFASRTRYPIESGVLKAGVNVVTTNIYCGWRDCGMRGPAENRAIRFADNTTVPLSNPWKYQEVPDRLIGPRLPWGSAGATLD
jgi:sialate O-acetylesterase